MSDQDLTTPHVDANLFCPGCQYNLRGIESDRCPECGIVVERGAIAAFSVPWECRREIGFLKAFLKTCALSIFRPGRLGDALVGPVRYRDAQQFRWIITLLLAVIVGYYLHNTIPPRQDPIESWLLRNTVPLERGYKVFNIPSDLFALWITGIEARPLLGLIALLISISWTGIPSYVFQFRGDDIRQENRAIALSYYSCVPLLAVLLTPIVFELRRSWLDALEFGYPQGAFRQTLFLLMDHWPVRAYYFSSELGLLLWVNTLWRLLGRTVSTSYIRRAGLILILFVTLVPLTFALVVATPMLLGFSRLVFHSYGS